MTVNIKKGSIVDYGSIICIVKVISKTGKAVIKSEKGNLYKVDLNEMPDEIIVVPTLQEAFDIIEMEDIERDLDF